MPYTLRILSNGWFAIAHTSGTIVERTRSHRTAAKLLARYNATLS